MHLPRRRKPVFKILLNLASPRGWAQHNSICNSCEYLTDYSLYDEFVRYSLKPLGSFHKKLINHRSLLSGSFNCSLRSPMFSFLPNFLLGASFRTSVMTWGGLVVGWFVFVTSFAGVGPVPVLEVFPSDKPRSGASFLRFSMSFFFKSEKRALLPLFFSVNNCSFSSMMVWTSGVSVRSSSRAGAGAGVVTSANVKRNISLSVSRMDVSHFSWEVDYFILITPYSSFSSKLFSLELKQGTSLVH